MYQNPLQPLPTADPIAPVPTVGPQDRIKIGWEKFQLGNGLTVIVHENRSVPLVAVNLWYKVGAKDEPAGKTGLAHLFEHLMFGGSRHMPGSYLANIAQTGATEVNGTTNGDRTNFYQTVPVVALDVALFAESDRMGHFLETLSAETLEQQRGVVLNEKRQTEGQPYGMVQECLARGLFPPHHPYGHTTLGWQADVEGITLEDARDWFRTYYGPSNAVLVLAGDVDTTTVRVKVQTYFGHIAPGPTLRRPRRWMVGGQPPRREVLEDRVPQPRLVMAWNIPPAGDEESTRLSLAATLLGGSASAWLRRRCVDELKIALDVNVGIGTMLLTGQFVISATLPQGGDLAQAEAAIRSELDRFLAEGPSADELERTQIQAEAGLIRQLERNQAVADLLAMNEVYFGDPSYYEGDMARLAQATCADVHQTAKTWLGGEAAYTLHVLPRAELAASGVDIDRSAPPMIDPPGGISLPRIDEARLSNGMRVVVAGRHGLPLISCKLLLPRGGKHEPRSRMGIAALTADLMMRGAGERDADAFMHFAQRHAVGLSAGCGLDFSAVSASALRSRLDLALDLLADVARRPRLDTVELDRIRSARLQGLQGAYAAPAAAVSRVVAGLMYGRGHVYARLGEGLAETLAAIERADVEALHRQVFQPEGATFLIAGDTTLDEMVTRLEARFGDWSVPADAPPISAVAAARPAAPGVYFIDRPGAAQTTIAAALIVPGFHDVDPFALKTIDTVLGGTFSSRLNMNLREARHWTYGAHSELGGTLAERVYATVVPVQADRTAQSMAEILREYRDLIGVRPIDADNLAMVQQSVILGLPNRCQTVGDLVAMLELPVQFDLSFDYWIDYADRMNALELGQVNALARQIIRPEQLVWIVAGDRAQVEAEVRALDLGEFHLLSSVHDDMYR